MGRRDAVALALLQLVTTVLRGMRALQVTPSTVASLSGGERTETERFMREWKLLRDPGDDVVSSIISSVACQVYISLAPPSPNDGIATVRVVGDSEAIVQRISVESAVPAQLHLVSPKPATPVRVEGHVRVEIIVHNAALVASIEAAGSGDVVVDDSVLATTNPQGSVVLSVTGSGDLFLPPHFQINADALHIASSDSGSMHFIAGDIIVNSLKVQAKGSGDINCGCSSLQASSSIAMTSSGTGTITAFAATLSTPKLYIMTQGSGDAKLLKGTTRMASSDDVTTCDFVSSGSGSIKAGSVACSEVEVVSSGSGDVTVQARHKLSFQESGSGDVYYAGTRPQTVESSSRKHVAYAAASSEMTPVRPTWVDTYNLPRRESSIEIVYTDSTSEGDFDAPIPERGHDNYGDDKMTHAGDQDRSHDPFPWKRVMIVVGVVFGVVLWDSGRKWRARRKKRGEEKPLITEDTPVYI